MTRCANNTLSVLIWQRRQDLVEKKLKVGVSWAQVVDDRVPAMRTIAAGVQVSSTSCDSAKIGLV